LISRKRLVVNADDFGFTPDVNRGILAAHRDGILTATTLMANGEAFDDAVRLARETPSLDVGCHLVLISGRSLLPPYAPLPASVPELLRALAARRIRVYDELAAQVRKILAAGFAHASGYAQAHAPGAAGAGRGRAHRRRVRDSLGAAAVRYSAHRARGGVPWLKRATSGSCRCCAAVSTACWRATAAAPRTTSRDSRSPGGSALPNWRS
jgi:hypothetical protein